MKPASLEPHFMSSRSMRQKYYETAWKPGKGGTTHFIYHVETLEHALLYLALNTSEII